MSNEQYSTEELGALIDQHNGKILKYGEERQELLDKLEALRDVYAETADSKVRKVIQDIKSDIEEIGEAAHRVLQQKRTIIQEYWQTKRREHEAARLEAVNSYGNIQEQIKTLRAEFEKREKELKEIADQHSFKASRESDALKKVPSKFDNEYHLHGFYAEDKFLPALPWEWNEAKENLEKLSVKVQKEEVDRLKRSHWSYQGGGAKIPTVNIKEKKIVLDDSGRVIDLIAKVGG